MCKVMLLSTTTAGFGLAIYNYMSSGDVGYLDLSNPTHDNVICLTKWPLRQEHHNTWLDLQVWYDWAFQKADWEAFISQRKCASSLDNSTMCRGGRVPLDQMNKKLATPMGDVDSFGHAHDLLDLYSHLFLWLSLFLWVAINTHDCALLSAKHKDYVLDWSGLNQGFPVLRFAFSLTGFFCWRRLLPCWCMGKKRKVLGLTFAILVFPALLAWATAIFLVVLCPLIALLFLFYPCRLSRFWIFILCIAMTVYGFELGTASMVFLADGNSRPHYAVTWASGGCTCGCTYPVSASTCTNLLLIGVGACIKAIMVALRTLKGLRRAQWANMMFLTFAVPVTVYAVEWTTADGEPIMHREPG